MEEQITCCFCGRPIKYKESHDPRPIVSKYGLRCCLQCNNNIVCPTRLKVWDWETKARWFNEFAEKYGIDNYGIGEYSANPIIETFMQLEDFRACDALELAGEADE